MKSIYQKIGITEKMFENWPSLTVMKVAKYFGWKHVHTYTDPAVIIFQNDKVRLSYYYEQRKVKTDMDHPRRGVTELFREEINLITLINLFLNPRMHTGKGRYKNAWKKHTNIHS